MSWYRNDEIGLQTANLYNSPTNLGPDLVGVYSVNSVIFLPILIVFKQFHVNVFIINDHSSHSHFRALKSAISTSVPHPFSAFLFAFLQLDMLFGLLGL